jgi:hypothetical protein
MRSLEGTGLGLHRFVGLILPWLCACTTVKPDARLADAQSLDAGSIDAGDERATSARDGGKEAGSGVLVPGSASPDAAVQTQQSPSSTTLREAGGPDAESESIDASVHDTQTPEAGVAGDDSPLANPVDSGVDASNVFTVHGHVVSSWGAPFQGVAVASGGVSVTTDEQGAFTFYGISAPYDVSFVSLEHAGAADGFVKAVDCWTYQGLTRSDPTLVALRGGITRSAQIEFLMSGADGGTPVVQSSVGYPYGRMLLELSPTVGAGAFVGWTGPDTFTGTAHAISFFFDPETGLPRAYSSYAEQQVTVDGKSSKVNTFTFDLTDSSPPIETTTIEGNVTGADARLDNELWLTFPSGAALLLAERVSSETDFSYLAPIIPDSSITLRASLGTTRTADFRLAHVSRTIALGTASDPVVLELPSAPTLLSPAEGANVDTDTVFTWSDTDTVSVMTLTQDTEDTGPLTMHVVTTNSSVRAADTVIADWLVPGAFVGWMVETHGQLADVDAATGPKGLLDAFTEGELSEPLRGDGFYASSVQRTLSTSE